MHEYTLMSEIVHAVETAIRTDEAKSPRRRLASVRVVRLRHGSAFSPDALRQAFELASRGTALEGAALAIETVAIPLTCGCGHQQTVTADEVAGHLWLCPRCGGVLAVGDQEDLVLLSVEVDDDTGG